MSSYGSPPTPIDIDDRALAHLQVVIIGRLRRSEGFLLSLPADVSTGSGRKALWIHAALPIQFSYAGSRMPTINAAWIEILTRAANSGQGLVPLAEPEPGSAQPARAA
ncbi:ATP-dependent DNA ligase [Rathayibacter sp. SD072]|nr:ATP-dependent DNA ligase [Rathayibacter sp. SD072]